MITRNHNVFVVLSDSGSEKTLLVTQAGGLVGKEPPPPSPKARDTLNTVLLSE